MEDSVNEHRSPVIQQNALINQVRPPRRRFTETCNDEEAIRQWLVIEGESAISDDTISFDPTAARKRLRSKRHDSRRSSTMELEEPFTLLRSNAFFESGEILGQMYLEDYSVRIQFAFRSGEEDLYVGANIMEYAFGIVLRERERRRPLDLSGMGIAPPLKQWLPFRISVRGSQIEFSIRGTRVAFTQAANLGGNQLELTIGGTAKGSVKGLIVSPTRPVVFVVMQFTPEFTTLYTSVIKPVCENYGYEVVRGDDVYTNGLIIEDIANSVREASLVIADVTPNNANVFYEVGFSHGIGKPTILLSDRQRDKLPFDVAAFRLIYYDNTIGGKSLVEEALHNHLRALRGGSASLEA